MKKISLILLLFVICFVFYQGTRSSYISIGYSDYIINFINRYITVDYVVMNFLIRKLAHFLEYFVLGIIICIFSKDFKLSMIFIFIISISDEFLQGFFGRTSAVYDVIIDSIGGFIGITIQIVIKRLLDIYYKGE